VLSEVHWAAVFPKSCIEPKSAAITDY